jgi:hypothetical protein
MEYALYIKESKYYRNCKNHHKEVIKTKQDELDTISEISVNILKGIRVIMTGMFILQEGVD